MYTLSLLGPYCPRVPYYAVGYKTRVELVQKPTRRGSSVTPQKRNVPSFHVSHPDACPMSIKTRQTPSKK
jgi:hypothetical protein